MARLTKTKVQLETLKAFELNLKNSDFWFGIGYSTYAPNILKAILKEMKERAKRGMELKYICKGKKS